MTGLSDTAEGTVATSSAESDPQAELEQLRLRVAAQDRLIAAMLEENQSIHELRRSTGELARIYHRFRGTPAFDAALAARARVRRVLGRSSPVGE